MNKKKKSNISLAEKVRREKEIKDYGKMVSLKPSIVQKSKKDYSRKWKLEDYED